MRRYAPLPPAMLECLSYDAATGEIRWKRGIGPKSRVTVGGLVYTQVKTPRSNKRPYRYIEFGGRGYFAHRVAWFLATGEQPTGMIDHINQNSLDNRICNLRQATDSQNAANSAAKKKRDLPKGVHSRRPGRFTATITKDRVQRTIGTFDTPEEASAAYLETAKRLFGEFARAA